MLSQISRLFAHTAETPPPAPVGFPPQGLERPDPSEMAGIEAESVPAYSAITPAEPQKSAREATFGASIGGDAYGLTFMIEYAAADGEISRRRIMLRSISQRDDGRIYLQAYCLERRAIRAFRLDRVIRVIDSDGVVFEDPIDYLRNEIHLSLPGELTQISRSGVLSQRTSTPVIPQPARPRPATPRAVIPRATALIIPQPEEPTPEPPGYPQRRCARDGLRVLVALARSDGLLHPTEVEAILDYIEAVCRRAGVSCGHGDRIALDSYLRRQRPDTTVLEQCLKQLDQQPIEDKRILLDHANRLIDADGHQHDAEHRILAEIRNSLTHS